MSSEIATFAKIVDIANIPEIAAFAKTSMIAEIDKTSKIAGIGKSAEVAETPNTAKISKKADFAGRHWRPVVTADGDGRDCQDFQIDRKSKTGQMAKMTKTTRMA